MSDSFNKPNKEYVISRHSGIWILLGSLLINFFMLGLLVASACRPPHPPAPPLFGGHEDFVDNLTRQLPANDAALLRAEYKKEEPVLDAGHQSMHEAMQNLAESLSQPTINQATLQKNMADITTAHGKIEAGMSDLITYVAANLSPEGRRIFAQNGLHPPGMGPNRGPGMDGPQDRHFVPPPDMDMPPPPGPDAH